MQSPTELTVHHKRYSRGVRWLAVLAWMAVIFVLSSVRDPQVPGGLTTPGHAVLYAVLGGLLVLALRPGRSRMTALAAAVLIASAYGVSDELHQAFVPTRMPDVLDWAWDTVGAAIGAVAIHLAARSLELRRR